jgi:hypothetical protein
VLSRYPHIKRLIVVADRGLLSLDNIEALGKLKLTGDQPLEFILAVPGRRYSEFEETLAAFQVKASQAEAEIVDEATWQSLRLVVAHNPERAREQTDLRRQRIAMLQQRADELAAKLDGQDAGQVRRGRKLSDSGAKARFFHEVADARLSRIIKVDLASDLFTYDIDTPAQQRAELMDGKLLLVTNVKDLTPQEIVSRYKALADIERGFKVLKSEIEIAPVFHRLPERIKAHASICFMALIVYRVMRQRLKLAKSTLSPEAALDKLRRIQRHSVSINAGTPIGGVSTINQEQASVLAALIDSAVFNLNYSIAPSSYGDGSNRHEIAVARCAARKARASHSTAQGGPDVRRDCGADGIEPHRRVRHLQAPRGGGCEGLARRAQWTQDRRRSAAGRSAGGDGAQAHHRQDP